MIWEDGREIIFSNKEVKKVNLLDLTFHQPNTQSRSRGFADGLAKTIPSYETVLSINSQSRYATAYQLVRDALTVYPQINLIFAINDITAWGAINACRDLNIDPEKYDGDHIRSWKATRSKMN